MERWIMSRHNRIITLLLLALSSTPALACDLNDCTLSGPLHQVGESTVSMDRWTWMNHDLAVARKDLAHGERAHALALIHDLDRILRTQLDAVVADRGAHSVRAFHAALQAVATEARGWPLAELEVDDPGNKG